MLNLDFLKIQKTIEDFRLNFALKFEKFLVRKLNKFQQFLLMIFSAKNFASFAIILTALISIYAQTSRDIGYNSAFNLEVLLQNNHNFFEVISLINFYLFLPATFLAKIFNISAILAAIIFINFLGILSLFFVKKIIERSNFLAEKLLKNLLILSFSLAFFIRPIALIFNDFFTQESLILIFLLPYLALWIASPSCSNSIITKGEDYSKSSLRALQRKSDLLAILIILINPFFVILIFTIEINKFLKKEIIRSKFLIRIMVIFTIIFAYFYYDKFYLNSFLLSFSNSLYFTQESIRVIFREDFLPIIYFISASYLFVKNNQTLQKLYLIIFAIFAVLFFDIFSDFSARFLILNLALPLIFTTCYLLVKNGNFDFRNYAIFLLIILFISQFDAKNIFSLGLDISSLFFLFIIYFRFAKEKKIDEVFYPKSLKNILIFSSIFLLTIITAFYQKFAYFSWFLSSIIFANFIYFAQKNFAKDKLNLLSSCVILLVLSYFISLNLASIFAYKNFHQEAFALKSPNFLSSEIINISKKNLAKNENLIIISSDNLAANSLIYLQKDNLIRIKNLKFFIEKMDCQLSKTARNNEIECGGKMQKMLLENLITQIADKKTKLIFIKNSNGFCEISFMEKLLQNKEFAEVFLKNYQFYNRVIEEDNFEKINFFKNDEQESKIKFKKIINDFEIYIK